MADGTESIAVGNTHFDFESHSTASIPKPVVLNISQLDEPPVFDDALKATIGRKSEMLELSINGHKSSCYVEIAVQKEKAPSNSVLFLHGARFSSQNWIEIDVLDTVASWGFKAVAVDLPGFGKSKDKLDPDLRSSFVAALIAALKIEKPVIVSPSMSGQYSLPFLFHEVEKSTERASGFVPVAPVDVKVFENVYSKSQLPTLIVYGTKDASLGLTGLPYLQRLPKSLTAPVQDAGHACYLDDPKTFIKYLHSFLTQLKG